MSRQHLPGRLRRATAVAAAVLALAGCGTSVAGQGAFAGPDPTSAGPTSAGPTSAAPTSADPTPEPSSGRVLVHGRGVDTGGRPVSGILVGFRPAGGTLTTARTGADGSYQLALATGEYEVACAVTGGTCRLAVAPNSETARVRLSGSTATVDLVAVARTPTPDPPAPTGDDTSARTISGRVLDTRGLPVAGITVEFKIVPTSGIQQQPFTQTDNQGRYAIDLPAGVYNALCIVNGGGCGPKGGDGGPFPVTVPPDGQHLDFVACSLNAYPACLRN